MNETKPVPHQLTAMEFLRGDGSNGSPSASELSSLLAESAMLIASIDRPPSRMPRWIQGVLDAVNLALRKLAWEVFFLVARIVALIFGYIVTAAMLYVIYYCLF